MYLEQNRFAINRAGWSVTKIYYTLHLSKSASKKSLF